MRIIPLVLAVALLAPHTAAGQAPVAPPAVAAAGAFTPTSVGEIAFGGRVTSVSGDPARFQRYRDLRSGPTIDLLRYLRETPSWVFTATADHVGYRDQHYAGSFERYGRVKASVDWNQIPLFFSTDTRTPYTQTSPGVFRLNDATRGAVQAKTSTTSAYLVDASRFDLRARRDTADARFVFAATPHLDLSVAMKSTARNGAQPWGASLGFSDAVELPVPIDHRTNDLNAALEWSSPRGMAKVAYDGSWFTNHVGTLVWDNPLRLTDTTSSSAYSSGDGTSQGRMGLWPDSTAHTVSASGALTLPARSRAFGYVSVGTWLQDAQLLPYTINTAIPVSPLARTSAEAEARIVAMNYRVTSRPTPTLWLNAQYRLYDYDNRTPHFAVDEYVRLDQAVGTSATGGSEPFGYTRHFADLDASYTPFRFVAFRAGYGLETDRRTFRYLDDTTEHTVRGSIDSTGFTWGTMRLQYDHAVRTGTGFDEQALSDIGEQVSLRQFDISDRTRDRLSAIVQVVPVDTVGLNVSVALGQDHRPDASFGLQDNNVRSVSVGADLTPRDSVLIGVSYVFENYSTLQRSRQANPGPQFDDPTRDWSTDMNEDVHTLTGSLDLPQLTSRASLRVGYDLVHSNARYLYLVPADSTLTPPQQLAPVLNKIQRLSADLRHSLAGRLGLGVGYAYDAYDVEDFALSPGTLSSPVLPAYLNLTYQFRPYNAHTGYVRVFYTW